MAPAAVGSLGTVPVASERNVIMVGAGGHARVCLEALLDDPANRVVGAVSRDGAGLAGLDVRMLGRDVDLAECARAAGATHAFVAVGGEARARLVDRCLDAGLELVDAVSRFAMLSRSVQLGGGVAVLPGAVVNAGTVLRRGAIVNTNASVDHDCDIGEFAHVAPGVAIAGDVTVGAGTLVGIGARVLQGLHVGAGVTVGGGAVVVADVADGLTVVGIPARPRP